MPPVTSLAGRAGLPQRYIAKSVGELQSDPQNAGIWLDGGGQRYLQSDGNWYRVVRDDANRTWRIVHPDEPNKPGIPVQLNADGTVSVHGEVGIKGGGWGRDDDTDPLLPNSTYADKRRDLNTEIARVTREIEAARRDRDDANRELTKISTEKEKLQDEKRNAASDEERNRIGHELARVDGECWRQLAVVNNFSVKIASLNDELKRNQWELSTLVN